MWSFPMPAYLLFPSLCFGGEIVMGKGLLGRRRTKAASLFGEGREKLVCVSVLHPPLTHFQEEGSSQKGEACLQSTKALPTHWRAFLRSSHRLCAPGKILPSQRHRRMEDVSSLLLQCGWHDIAWEPSTWNTAREKRTKRAGQGGTRA